MKTVRQIWKDLGTVFRLPRVTINLMFAETQRNDPFYQRIVGEMYNTARRRHRKNPFVRSLEYGVALCPLPSAFDDYFMMIEAAGRRNVKKARRMGYTFQRIAYNDYLDDVRAIRNSTDVRQGKLAEDFGEVRPCTDPPTRTDMHDYAYYGVLRDGHLLAYGSCFISGELCMLEHILGHAECLSDGIVPLLIVGIARELMEKYPRVRYFGYGTYFGCGTTLRRFKKKFLFLPHRVSWELG